MHPVLFAIDGFPVHTYGVTAGLAFLVGVGGAAIVGSREGLSWDFLWELALVIIAGVVVGGRLEYVRTRWDQYAAAPLDILDLRDGGQVFYGGLLGGVLAALVFMRWRGQPAWRTLDLYAPFIALGHAIGRVGCFAAGCCYGAPPDVPWAVVFPMGGKPPGGVPLHPTQLYEVGANALLAVLLFVLRARLSPGGTRPAGTTGGDGVTFAVLLLGYTMFRTVNELFRGDQIRGTAVAGLSNGQVISAALFVAGLVIVWARWPRSVRPSGAPA